MPRAEGQSARTVAGGGVEAELTRVGSAIR